MGIRLSAMLANTTELTVPFDGEDVQVCYRPNAVTLDLSDKMEADAKAASEDHPEETGEDRTRYSWLVANLQPVMEWWDVLEDDGSRMAPTDTNMRRMPINFLNAVLAAILKDQKVDVGEDDGSADG
jgi:hypothetical protein